MKVCVFFSLLLCGILPCFGELNSGFDPERESQAGHEIVDLYEESLAVLGTVTDDYRRIRAMRLSQIRDIPFSEAYRNIDPVMPEFPPVNRRLLRRRLYDPQLINQHKAQVEEVQRQIEAMIDLTTRLLLEIEVLEAEVLHHQEQEATREVTLEEVLAREEFDPDQVVEEDVRIVEGTLMEHLVEAAQDRDRDDERFSDLTELMQQIEHQHTPPPVAADIADLTEADESLERYVQPDNLERMRNVRNLEDVEYTFGRKVKYGGEPVEWMFVDTWHIIGPWPNPSRAHIDRQFPPENIVDLNAAYIGKGGREIHWQFHQTRTVEVVPQNEEEYGIWYAYTEVYFDRPMDLWIATGSDDRGDIWLNGMPIWVSSDRLKAWRVDEGFRKVSFRQGVNRVLVRLENGWRDTAFSFGIYLGP